MKEEGYWTFRQVKELVELLREGQWRQTSLRTVYFIDKGDERIIIIFDSNKLFKVGVGPLAVLLTFLIY